MSGRIKYMRHKNKKSLKNLKQFRVRSKFVFYVLFRPLAQKLFFPIMGLILVVCIINHEYETKWQKDRWTFNHEPIAESHAQPTNDSSVTSPVADTKSPSESGESVTVKTNTRGSITHSPQVEVINLIKKYFPEESNVAVAIFKAESGLNPKKESDTDRMSDGRAFSAGLTQINLTVSEVAGINCTKAFSGQSYKAKVVDEKLYSQCLEAVKNPIHALESARKKYEGRKNTFYAWSVYGSGAYKNHL